jgi:hypothetical protein
MANLENPLIEQPKKKRLRTQDPSQTIHEARVDYWRENATWPNAEQEETMDRFRELIQPTLARKKSSASLLTRTPSDQLPREQKSTPYRHPRYESQLIERGSFMNKYKDISVEQTTLSNPSEIATVAAKRYII